MNEAISQLVSIPAPFNMIVLIVLIGTAGGVITTIVSEIRKYVCHRESLELKRELLDRGMSAPEVEQIVNAEPPAK